MKHYYKPAISHKPETLVFASLGLAAVASLVFTVSALVRFVDGVPQVVARLEQPRTVSPFALATAAGQATNLVAEVES